MRDNKPKYTAKKVITTSLIVDMIDLLTNLTVMILTGSAVFIAETLQGLTDIVAVAIVFFGVKRSKRKRDNRHHFGHGRELYFWTLIAAIVILLFSGVPSLFFGYQRMINPHPIENLNIAFIVAGLAILTNGYALKLSYGRLMERHKVKEVPHLFLRSPRVETKATFTLDLIGASSAIVSLSTFLIFALTGDLRFDALGAMIIGAILIIMALILILGIGDMIIGRSAPPEVEKEIRGIIKGHLEIRKILDLKTMYIGPDTILIDCEIFLKKTLVTKQIEQLIDELQDQIQASIPQAKFIQIEVETPQIVEKEKQILAAPDEY